MRVLLISDGRVGEGIRYVLLPDVIFIWDIPREILLTSLFGSSPMKHMLCGSMSSADGVGNGAG